MNLEDMIMVSVDDHVVEPPDMWEGRVPKKYADQAPRIVVMEDGREAWSYLGNLSTNTGLNAVAGRPLRTTALTRRRSPTCAPAATTYTSGFAT